MTGKVSHIIVFVLCCTYVGGYNDLGYLFPDSIGILRFVSLVDPLDTSDHYFQDVWEIAILDEAIYFQSKEKLMRWQNQPFTVWNSMISFSGIWVINDLLFVASRSGADIISDGQILKRFEYSSSTPLRSGYHRNIIYVSLRDGLAYIQLINNRWIDRGRINGIKDDIKEMVENHNGNLWLESQEDVVWKVELSGASNNTDFQSLHIIHFRHHKELPDGVLIFRGSEIENEISLPFRRNKIRFEFAATSFENESENLFQIQLVGLDEEWSDWSRETKRNYTNIPEGDYVFKIRAKNIYNHVGKEDTLRFTLLPPWHRTWWAYLIYLLGAVFLIWLFSVWYSRQLLRKNLILEAIVKRRMSEIQYKNDQLRQQTDKLKEMDIMKTRFFANISHEFRTPLTLIEGSIEKLEQNCENQISTFNIKMIRRNANRLLSLVNQLLDLSMLDSGKLRLNPVEGDAFKCMRVAASAFSSHAASRHIDYKIKIPSRQLWTSFDRDKLEKIISNLLSNAFKFTEDYGVIILNAHFYNHKLHLTISDTGSGISPDILPKIFDRFFHVDSSYVKEKVGSGIGLALTKELVNLMEGEIYVESEMDKGTIFKVVLPIEEIQSQATDESEHKSDFEENANYIVNTKVTPDRPKVLIIEDNHDMQHFITEELQGTYSLIVALNGAEGLQKASLSAPDLIITDLMMPQMDGITLCKKLKTTLATSHIPVIMLTAKAGIENKLEGLRTGADVYLTKPFDVRELLVQVGNLVGQRQKLRELYSKGITIDPKEITATPLDEEFLDQFHDLLEENYADAEFGLSQMQKSLTMSKTQLHRKLKALTKHPPGELLRNFRLKRAAQLLTQRSDNITRVAYDVGFNSLSYFTRCFKELHGVSPTEYMRRESSGE